MRKDGTIAIYAADKDIGVIVGYDGKKYHFTKKDWITSKNVPVRGMTVSFEPADGMAMKIRVIDRSSLS